MPSPIKKGHKKMGGRKKGTPNKLTKSIKEGVLEAYNALQKHPTANIVSWGEKNPTAFYNVAAKLIPTEIQAKVDEIMTIKVVRE